MTPTTLIFPITPAVHKRLTDQWAALQARAAELHIALASDGAFTGRATGRVTVAHDHVSVLITDKPFFVPMGVVNAELRKLFA